MTQSRRGPHGDLMVCGICGTVKGPVPCEPEGVSQLCSCPADDESQSQQSHGRDFDSWVELCYCCGLDTVSSGSRWSPFHCERCRPRVLALNGLLGHCVIPVGRHSLMNGVRLADPTRRTDAAFVAFADQLQTLFASIDELGKWAKTIVLTNLGTLSYEEGVDVYLDSYLRKARRQHLSPNAAFSSLVERIFGPDDGKLLASLCQQPAKPTDS